MFHGATMEGYGSQESWLLQMVDVNETPNCDNNGKPSPRVNSPLPPLQCCARAGETNAANESAGPA